MSQVLRRIASFKVNRGASHRVKDHEVLANALRNKERDKLLHEFLLAREELKAQFDVEKREIVGNYERRIHYLRRLLEEYDENVSMLKLNLDAEKEENFILKTKLFELESKHKYTKSEKRAVDDMMAQKGYLNESYDKESSCSSSPCSKQGNTPLKSQKEKSSLDGLKYSDRMASCGSIQQNSCFSSVSSLHSVRTDFNDIHDTHQNCRKEFSRLLEELRQQQEKFDRQLQEERHTMKERLEDEKLQLERVVYKQLNARVEREMKKQEYLFTENAHLRSTISNAIMERINARDLNKQSPSKDIWKENNSDSGADVEDNRSDDDSDISDSGKSSLTLSDRTINRCPSLSPEDAFSKRIISKLVEEPRRTCLSSTPQSKKEQRTNRTKVSMNNLNTEISMLSEHCTLQQRVATDDWCIDEISNFHGELKSKLQVLQELFTSDQELNINAV